MWTYTKATFSAVILALMLIFHHPAAAGGTHSLLRKRHLMPTSTAGPTTFPEIAFPSFRYVPWNELDNLTRSTARDGLSYIAPTWNVPFNASIESMWYLGLTAQEQAAAMEIGFDGEDQWDCYINHYTGYDWDELALYGLDAYWGALGWTKESWNGNMPPPPSEFANWTDLTIPEQTAADELCYFNLTWDQVNLMQWDLDLSDGTGTATTSAAPLSTTSSTTVPIIVAPTTTTTSAPNNNTSSTTAPISVGPTTTTSV